MRFTIPALAAALAFSFATPASAWIQHYQPIAAPTGAPSMSEIESWRDGLTNGNAALVQAHRDRLNRVLVAMGQPSPTKVQVNEGGYWYSHGVNRGWRDKWVDSTLAQCGNIPGNRCREVSVYSAMTATEARKWYEKFGNDRWKRIVNHLADIQHDFDVDSWGSWAELPREAFDVVTSSFEDNVSRYGLGAPDTQTPAQMGLAGAKYTGELDGKLSQSYKNRFNSLDPNNIHYWDANPLTVELGIEDDAVTKMYARVWFANPVAPKDQIS